MRERGARKATRTRAQGWIRSMREEGIHPHPGPRFISKNINGMCNTIEQNLESIKQENKKDKITAVFLQDHKVPRSMATATNLQGQRKRMLVAMAHGYTDPRGTTHGGTAIIIPYDSLELKKGETLQQAITRVRKTITHRPDGRVVTLVTQILGKPRKLVAAYAPVRGAASERADFFRQLTRKLTPNTFLGIDANCTPDPALDKHNAPSTASPNAVDRALRDMTATHNLVDVARRTLGDERFYSSHHVVAGQQEVLTRIDQIYAPDDAETMYIHAHCDDFFPHNRHRIELDHIAIEIRSEEQDDTPRGQDIQRVNEEVFKCERFNAAMARMLTSETQHIEALTSAESLDKWEHIKTKAKQMMLKETQAKRYKMSAELKQKTENLRAIRRQTAQGRGGPNATQTADALEEEVRHSKRTEYTLHQTLEKIAYSMGKAHDRCSAEFFRIWKPNNKSEAIPGMKVADWSNPSQPEMTGDRATDPRGILGEMTKYYTSLFKRKHPVPAQKEACLQQLNSGGNRVQPPTATKCDAPITHQEVEQVLNTLPTGKSAGPDCIPNAFYKTFAALLAPALAKVYNSSRDNKALPPTLLQGTISVLYKKADREDPRNYRPITLLNGDYKILTRILCRRMNEAVLQFVSPQQNGFVPGGFIAENIMLLKLLQAHVENEDDDAMFIFLDMEKAFDRCSWEYLIEALEHIGFEKGFADYIRLFYSHDNPPTRKITTRGYLGEAFELHSGVAQGCPLSPLLFLVVTEALTRLIQNDATIKGIRTGDTSHKVSQYADDSTLICKDEADVRASQRHIETWCGATGMAENASKREGMLLGKLNRERHRAPKGVIKDEAWAQDGHTIRALGVPMGNKLNEEAWWMTKLEGVKRRLSMWKTTTRLSLTGRNLLLQAILYGSLRYWLFFMTPSQRVLDKLQQEAYELLWATDPDMVADTQEERGRKTRAHIACAPSHLPIREGGGNVMHFQSHVKAFQIQWVRRYIHPGREPWKHVADLWTAEPYPLGRGMLFAKLDDRPCMYRDIPTTAPYWRECVRQFEGLQLKQNTNDIGPGIEGEPVFYSHRYDVRIPREAETKWSKYLGVQRTFHIIDKDTDEVFSANDMQGFAYNLAPNGIRGTPSAHEWVDKLMSTWNDLRSQIPDEVIRRTRQPPSFTKNEIVVLTPDGLPNYYARITSEDGDPLQLQKLWIDTHGTPHDTGTTVPFFRAAADGMAKVALWEEEDTDYQPFEQEQEDTRRPKKTYICGPATQTYPCEKGWKVGESNPKSKSRTITRLGHLTIKNLTALLTAETVGDARPNCEKNWQSRLPTFDIPFQKIWPSLGTPLSDATEEKQWRKLLHRGLNVRNRHSTASVAQRKCRRGCDAEESMLHVARCTKATLYWDDVFETAEKVLGDGRPAARDLAIIFNVWNSEGKLPSVPTRALLRHAFGCYYNDLSKMDTKPGFKMDNAMTFAKLMKNYTRAVTACGEGMAQAAISRQYTNKKLPDRRRTCNQLSRVLAFANQGRAYAVNTNLKSAESNAKQKALHARGS